MTKIDPTRIWALNYRMTMSVMASVAPAVRELKLELKELFLLASTDEHPYPADLAAELLMPKPTVTVLVKRLVAVGYLRRELDTEDLRRHRLTVTPAGRRATRRGLELLSAVYGARLARLTPAQQAELSALLEAMS